MRLDFKILWIDDQPKHVESFAEGIRRKLKELGFQLEIITASSLDEVNALIGDHVHDDGIDLVLVDYDLGTGDGGEEVLSRIRQTFPHKDLIFYSAADTDKLRRIAYDNKIDGVFFSTRLSLAEDTIGAIDRTLRRVMDIDHMRGVVMSATSDIDFVVERTLLAVYKGLPPDKKKEFVSGVVEKIRTKLEKWDGELTKAENKGGVEAVFKLKHLCTAADRLELLMGQLATLAGDGSTQLEKATEYKVDVVPRRNRLAHVMLKVVDGKPVLDGPEGPFTDEDMTKLRCDLIDHRGNFINIAVLIDVPLD